MTSAGYHGLYETDLFGLYGEQLERMTKRLLALRHHEAAARTFEAAAGLRRADDIRRELELVWQMVERIDGGESPAGSERGVVRTWRARAAVPRERVRAVVRLHRLEAAGADLRSRLVRGLG